MKKILLSFLFTLILLSGVNKVVLADGINVNLVLKNNGDIVYSGSVALLPAGIISINDSNGNPHDTNADSVLSIVNTADTSSGEFTISNLIYYNMFGAFYLKCINISGSDLCDNWQYKVNDESPAVGMDSKILSGGENVVLYFGDENKAPAPIPEPEPEPEPETPPVHRSSGGYIMPIQVILPPPAVVATPPPFSIPTEITPVQSNINLEEKPKTVTPSTYKKQTKKITKITKQNTATVINTISQTPSITQTETTKKSWWNRFWDSIFSIF
jgi:hypothetical protein